MIAFALKATNMSSSGGSHCCLCSSIIVKAVAAGCLAFLHHSPRHNVQQPVLLDVLLQPNFLWSSAVPTAAARHGNTWPMLTAAARCNIQLLLSSKAGLSELQYACAMSPVPAQGALHATMSRCHLQPLLCIGGLAVFNPVLHLQACPNVVHGLHIPEERQLACRSS